MPGRVIAAATKLKAKWLNTKAGKVWTWEKNRKFLNYHITKVKNGTGRILDIGAKKRAYHGPGSIYARERALLRKNGLVRVPTGEQLSAGGKHYNVYEWIPAP